jgi:very-short-patch-repair endonuclease
MEEIFYPQSHTELRRKLRNNPTLAERILWHSLQNRRLLGFKFRRQAGIGRYIADFYCPKAKLVVEIDGESHATPETAAYDSIRTDFMRSLGLQVIRFSNHDVLYENIRVLDAIGKYLNPSSS